jgi:hypothetical protein
MKKQNPLQLTYKITPLLFLAALTSFSAALAIAETPEEKGFSIAARSDRTDTGFGDSTVKLSMVLRNSAGQETTRDLRINTLEKTSEDVGDKSLVIFDSPRDIDGTALLSHAQILEPDNQWLYLPALKRIKRISSANKSGPFVGSEFAFEDFTSLELNKFSYKFIKEDTLDGVQADVVERYPRYKNSGYTKQIAWIDQEIHQIRKVEFYDRRDSLLKTLILSDYHKYGENVWRAQKLQMTNHLTRKSTDLLYSDYEFQTGLNEKNFIKSALNRIR